MIGGGPLRGLGGGRGGARVSSFDDFTLGFFGTGGGCGFDSIVGLGLIAGFGLGRGLTLLVATDDKGELVGKRLPRDAVALTTTASPEDDSSDDSEL